MTTPTKSCYNGVPDLPKKPGKDAYKFGASSNSLEPGGTHTPVSETLINAVDDLFYYTLLNYTQIAARLLGQGLQTTDRQIRSIRQRCDWLRVTFGPTFQQVEQVFNGPGRTFGRGWMITYLRQHCGFKAHQNDVATLPAPVAATSQAPVHPIALLILHLLRHLQRK